MLAYDLEDAQEWLEFGCRLIIYSQPEMVLARHFQEAWRDLSKSSPVARPK